MFKFLKEKLKGAIDRIAHKVEKEAPDKEIEVKEIIKDKKEIKKQDKEKKPKKLTTPKVKEEIIQPDKEVILDEKKEIKEELKQDQEEKHSFFDFLKKKPKEEIKEQKADQEIQEKQQEKHEKKGLFESIREKVTTRVISEKQFDDIFWDLEVTLLENNVAVEVIEKIKNDLKKDLTSRPIKRDKITDEIIGSLRKSISDLFNVSPVDVLKSIRAKQEKPYVIAFVGINGSGKCVTGDTLIPLSNGDLVPIEQLYNQYKSKEFLFNGDYYILEPDIEIFSLDKSLKIVNKKPISLCKLKSPKILREIKLSNGMQIKVTKEHPLLSINDANPFWISARDIKMGMYIAVPRVLYKKTGFDFDNELPKLLDSGFFVKVDSYEYILDYFKKTYGTLLTAHKKLKIKQSYTSFVGHWRYKKILPISLYLKLCDKLNIRVLDLQYGGSKSIPMPSLTRDLSELVGLVISEGHLNQKVCEITNKDIKIINRFVRLNKNLFNIKTKVFIDNRGLIRARIYNWTVINLLNKAFEIPFGDKSRKITIPKIIFKSNENIIKSFLKSYIEAEGHIGFGNRSIEIPTSSKKAALGLVHLFLMLGIETTLSERLNKFGKHYRIYINGASKHQNIMDFDIYTRKKTRLEYNNNLNKQFEVTNLVPKCGKYIKKLRTKNKLFRNAFSEAIGTTPSMITYYESDVSIPRQNLLQISKLLGSTQLENLANSEITWIKVSNIKDVKSKSKWVYDLSMENNNFICNNIVSHNTTTIAKFASMLQKQKISCVLAACDTFRAAAIHQLEEHGKNLGVKVIKHDYGADAAAVAFDAISHAQAKNIDVVLIDTAGRLHTNVNLMDEMKKIIRVAKPDLKIFVGESITGNDFIEQAKKFDSIIGIDGIVLAKADIDEKGGAAISVSYVTGKPILYMGTGQEYSNLEVFTSQKILERLGI